MTIYFGHGGEEELTTQVANKTEPSNLAVILLVSLVAVVAIVFVAKLLSKTTTAKPEAKKS
jgi:hypothetical protein